MTKSAEYMLAVAYAAEAFALACAEAEDRPAVGSMCAHDISRLALTAKDDAEERFGVRISATVDGEWNWSFS